MIEKIHDVGEFDKFVEQLPEEIVQSLWFTPVRADKAGDVPNEEDLTKSKYRLSLQDSRERLRTGKNVGIILGNQLSVLILTNPEKAHTYLRELPETLEVSTRSGELHRYYLRGDGIESRDIPGIVELRTGRRLEVAPGSYASDSRGEGWGTYTVVKGRKISKITASDLPRGLKPETRLGEEENVNGYGWRVESIREEDWTLESLLTRKNPPNLGFTSKTDADRMTIEKLLYWEFPPKIIIKIMKEYRSCGEEVASLYTEVYSKFVTEDRDVISDVVNVGTYRPGVEQKRFEEIKKLLNEWAFDNDKFSWGCDTKFVTFLEDVNTPKRKIEGGAVLELPGDLADQLIDSGKCIKYAWKCQKCGEIHKQMEKPIICENPSCGKKGPFKSLHPTGVEEVEKVLLNNYNFATIQETIRIGRVPKVYRYVGGRYVAEGTEGMIRKVIKNKLLPRSSPHFRSNVFRNIVASTAHLEKEFGIGEEEEKVVVRNGVLNLETLVLINHDPGLLALARVESNYDPKVKCPEFRKFLKRTIPNKDERRRFQELLGTALVNRKDHKDIFILVGKTDTGKSALLRMIEGVFGRDNVSNETITKLANSRWRLANLYGVLLNISHEISSGSVKREEDLKAAWDGDPVSVEEKGVQPFKIVPTCEHVYAANTTPQVTRSDAAFWNRVFVAISGERVPKSTRDSNIHRKIVEKESSGILNWIIEGYRRFKDNGGFTIEQSEEESADRWLNWGDSIERFIHKCIVYKKDNKISANELHGLYSKFVEARTNLEMKSQTSLTKRVKNISYVEYSKDFRYKGKRQRGFKHLTVLENKIDANDDAFSYSSVIEKEDRGSEVLEGVVNKRRQTCQTSKKVKIRVTKPFDYNEKSFVPDNVVELPENAAKKAINEGYAKLVERPESPSQLDKIRVVRNIIYDLQDDYEGGAHLYDVKRQAEAEAISPQFVEEFVKRKSESGRLIMVEEKDQTFVKFVKRGGQRSR